MTGWVSSRRSQSRELGRKLSFLAGRKVPMPVDADQDVVCAVSRGLIVAVQFGGQHQSFPLCMLLAQTKALADSLTVYKNTAVIAGGIK